MLNAENFNIHEQTISLGDQSIWCER